MIVLKILLWILFVLLCIITMIFLVPVGGKAGFVDGKFSYEVFLSFIPIMNSEKKGILDHLKKSRKPKKEESYDDFEISDNEDEFTSDKSEEIPENNSVNEKNDESTDSEGEDDTETESCENIVSETETEELKEKKPKKKKADSEKTEKPQKSTGDKIEMLLDIWRAADRPLLKIFKGFRFSDIYIDFIIANEDAYKCALTYGAVSGTVYNLLGFMGTLFTVKFRTVDVNAGFGLKESRWDASVKVDFRLGTLVIAGVWFLITYIFRIFIPNKINKNKLKKQSDER